MGRGTALGPLLFWVQGSRQLPTLPALASPQPPSPFLPWAHRELRGCCSGTVEGAQAPHSVVKLHKKGSGPPSMGVTGDARVQAVLRDPTASHASSRRGHH